MYAQDQHQPVEVLLVEDNLLDVEFARRVFKNNAVPCRLHVVYDGLQALRFLRREGEFRDSPRPDILLLDLHLPEKDGFEVLKELRDDPNLQGAIVIVLTSEEDPERLVTERGLEASLYLRKHDDMGPLVDKLHEFDGRKINVVQRPEKQDGNN